MKVLLISCLIGIIIAQNIVIEATSAEDAHMLFAEKVLAKKKLEKETVNIYGNFSTNLGNFIKFGSGKDIYLSHRKGESELVICQNNKTENNSDVLSQIFYDKSKVEHFQKKGFLFQKDGKYCQGYLYKFISFGEELVLALGFVHELLAKVYPLKLKESVSNYKPPAILLKVQHKGDFTDVKFEYAGVNFMFLKEALNKTDKVISKAFPVAEVAFKQGKVLVHFAAKEIDHTVSLHKTFNVIFEIFGDSLHRRIDKHFFTDEVFLERLNFNETSDCNILLLDTVSEETYVDQDEIRAVPYMKMIRYDVFDIEKPTENGRQYNYIAQVDFNELHKTQEIDDVFTVSYPIHFRYQAPHEKLYAGSLFYLRTKIYTNCAFKNSFSEDEERNFFFDEYVKDKFGSEYKKIKARHFESEKDMKEYRPTDVKATVVPVGDPKLKNLMKNSTILIVLVASAVILYTIWKSDKKKKTD